MAGAFLAIHILALMGSNKTPMPGTRPGMTNFNQSAS
jgi:hypothetical protein